MLLIVGCCSRLKAVVRQDWMRGRNAAIAVGRAQELGSRCLARSRHRLTRQRGGLNYRYRGDCSHPAWQSAGSSANSRSNVSCSKDRTHNVDPKLSSALIDLTPQIGRRGIIRTRTSASLINSKCVTCALEFLGSFLGSPQEQHLARRTALVSCPKGAASAVKVQGCLGLRRRSHFMDSAVDVQLRRRSRKPRSL